MTKIKSTPSALKAATMTNSIQSSSNVVIDGYIQAGDWGAEDSLFTLCEEAIRQCIEVEANASILNGSEVSLLFTDDDHIKAINRNHRGFDKPTNVLSFPQHEANASAFGPMLGDIVLGFETTKAEANLEEKSLEHHIQHLIIHGFLHLLGYDHEEPCDAKIMEDLEIKALGHLGISNPYKDTELL